MSRKDYVEIAKAIKTARERHPAAQEALRFVIGELAYVLQCDNPRFDKTRFLDACGFGNFGV